jgi:hypothetical protein
MDGERERDGNKYIQRVRERVREREKKERDKKR